MKKPTHTDGTATFDVVTGTYSFSVDKTDYKSYPNELLTVGKDIQKTIRLDPISTDGGGGTDGGTTDNGTTDETGENSLDVQVYDDSTWDIVEGALVTVGDQVGTTDASGYVTLQFTEAKEYDISVTAIGYQDYSNIVPIDQFQGGSTTAYLTPAGGDTDGEIADGGHIFHSKLSRLMR